MRHHLPVLSLFTPRACRPTAVALSTGSRTCLPFHISSLLSYIVRPKSLLHVPLSPFSFLSSDQNHSVYPFHLSLSSCRPAQVTPSYIPFTFISSYYRPTQVTPSFSLFLLFFRASRPPGHSLTLPRTLEARGPALLHSRITIYSRLHTQPISLSLPRTSPIRASRFTRSSSLFHYLCPGLRPFAHHGLHAAPAYFIISAPDFAHSRTTVYMQLQPISSSLPRTSPIRAPQFTRDSSLLHYDFLSTPTLRLERNSIRNIVHSRLYDTHIWFVHDSSYASLYLMTFL
ncbi:uncharacterized protein BJ212DRAFT_665135 [Suillus subaureus]|uniref:Uncharacterized protein n=1 Tax=Suillus subaureus TaxID=48587 RepID=A0A9P7J8L5_9AGAM|nr:uncharacterized protein BJ212DRAFT_665135 [Suillus subaureus]KAG1808203.1 hypothetical protein BJ212DRAFT_665135 [Suillus subaureus]